MQHNTDVELQSSETSSNTSYDRHGMECYEAFKETSIMTAKAAKRRGCNSLMTSKEPKIQDYHVTDEHTLR